MKTALKKIIIFALMLAFTLPCFAGLSALDVSAGTTEIELIQKAISQLKEEVKELSSAIDSKADTETVDAKLAELEAAISNAESVAKSYSDTQDNALKTELEAAIASAKTELTEAISKKADAETVNAKITELETKIDTLNTELDGSKKRADELEAKSSKLHTLTVIVCFISGISLGGCCALAIYTVVNKKKKHG